jgi:alkylation response protein AidB-like acyl-CoA dehydrogenase
MTTVTSAVRGPDAALAAGSAEGIREAFREWLKANASEFEPHRTWRARSFEDDVAAQCELQRLLYDSGWGRVGWPESCGGLGGDIVGRGIVYDELTAAGIAYPHFAETMEIVASTLLHYTPHLAQRHLPAALEGRELWCQAFSEPNAGSDLTSLTTRAVREGGSFRVTGQKVWQSFGHVSSWTMLLARTGTSDSRHRGLTMLWVDMATPGITIRPIAVANGRNELAEVFFDDVIVPVESIIGEVDAGWAVTMYLMQFERGMYAWQRQAHLHMRLADAVRATTHPANEIAASVGDAYLALFALRTRTKATLQRLAAGENVGPEASIDKAMLSATEQLVYDTARELFSPAFELDDSDVAHVWRDEWMYSRSTSIFGGAAEVQRDLIAERLLSLPRSRPDGR